MFKQRFDGKPEPQYSLEEKVFVQGWVNSDTGVVLDIQWIYHRRLDKHIWGYKIKYDGKVSVLNLLYVPEGYLRKIE